MNTELIITLIIILLAIGYAVFLCVRYFKRQLRKRNTPDECTGCDSDCDGCPFAPHKL